jgi:hypothetical protein
MKEGYYFWNRADWPVKDIPDPQDPNPLRYAILASIVEVMANQFNRKISLGLRRGSRGVNFQQDRERRLEVNKPFEEVPPWASSVPPVEEWISFLQDKSISEAIKNKPSVMGFHKRRICADAAQLGNI